MSTSLDIPSSSGIVIVDNTISNDNTTVQLHKTTTLNTDIHHPQQLHSHHQLINNDDDFLNINTQQNLIDSQCNNINNNNNNNNSNNNNNINASVSSGVINFTTNDLLNNQQIIKLINNDDEQIHDQTMQQQQIPQIQQTTTRTLNQNSKVHVISNLPFNPTKHQQHNHPSSHQHQQQTINLLSNGKNLTATGSVIGNSGNTGGVNFVNAYISKTTAGGKIVNIPVKTTTSSLSSQSPATASTQNLNQLQQHHVINKTTTTGGNQLIQKLQVPRNVQFVTRTQNTIGGNNIIMSRNNNNNNNNNIGHHHHQQQHIILPSNSAAVKQTTNINIKNKQGLSSVKILQNKQLPTSSGVKNVLQQQQQQHQQQLQQQQNKLIKTTNVPTVGVGGIVGTNSTVTGNSNIINNISGIAQHQQQPQQQNKILKHYNHGQIITNMNQSYTTKNLHLPTNITYSNNNNNNNNNNNINNNISNNNNSTINKIQQRSTNNVLIQGKVITKGNKYIVQNQQQQQQQQQLHLQHHQQQQPTHLVLPTTPIINTNSNNILSSNNIGQIQQLKLSATPNFQNSGTIKYVNAQGNVIPPPTKVRAILQTMTSVTTNNQQQQLLQQPQQQQHIYNDSIITTSNHNIVSSSSVPATASSSSASLSSSSSISPTANQSKTAADDYTIVNGTPMTDEMSARILQSLSQKIIYNNNNNNNSNNNNNINNRQIQQQTQNVNLQQKIHHQLPQHPHPQTAIPNQQLQQQQQHIMIAATVSSQQEPPPLPHAETGPKVIHDSRMFKVSSCDQTTTTTFIDNIPLTSTRGDNITYTQQDGTDQDDELIGEEIRPAPMTVLDGSKIHLLQAVLQDHTYVAAEPERPQEQPQIYQDVQPTTLTSSAIQSAGLNYGYKTTNNDDDANSAISTGSRNGMNTHDNDLGEETETAPEAEGEDDSVTRCICDLTHDDGYMICCDKCSAWQHVDCMGIDRQNIPDEYKCEICQPRQVDKQRARQLQLMKRKEQQSLMFLNTTTTSQQQQQLPLESNLHLIGGNVSGSGGIGISGQQTTLERNQLHTKNNLPITTTKKQKGNTVRRKSDISSGTTYAQQKKAKRDLTSRANGKRRESKKPSKRKSKHLIEPQAEKPTTNLRAWIENYEQAITNHYSPELRARIHANGKHNQHAKELTPIFMKNINHLDSKCTTVPHAGGKILISTIDIGTNVPIVEIRGKYMLSSQYRQQLALSTSTSTVRNHQYNRKPGPFIFFYRLPNDGPEVCIDTRTYGNEARFVRRSCRPNSEVLHSIEKGTIHLYIVSLTNIIGGTEITIKHEPHDLLAISRGTVTASTSTICACGCPKDCLFSSSSTILSPTTNIISPKQLKRLNGHIPDDSLPPYRRSKSLIARGRSTSSSGGDNSNTGMLSPNNNLLLPLLQQHQQQQQQQHIMQLQQPIQSPIIQQDTTTTALYSLPSPTILSLPSPLSTSSSSSIPRIPLTSTITLDLLTPETSQPKLQSPNNEKIIVSQQQSQLFSSTASSQSIVTSPILPVPVKMVTPQKINHQIQNINNNNKKSPNKIQRNIFNDDNLINVVTSTSSVTVTTPTTPQSPGLITNTLLLCDEQQQQPQQQIQQQQLQQQALQQPQLQQQQLQNPITTLANTAVQPTTIIKTREKKDSSSNAKLTREERKMQAIVRAFEKMEKNQERKQQLKQQKTTPPSLTTTAITTSSSTTASTRRNSSSPSLRFNKDDENDKNFHSRKKKRKGSKSYQQLTHQKKRRRSRLNSGESDLLTSEESTSLLSPPLPLSGNICSSNLYSNESKSPIYSTLSLNHNNLTNSGQPVTMVNSAAGLLLALSHPHTDIQEQQQQQCSSLLQQVKSPQQQLRSQENNQMTSLTTVTTQPLVSSACLLIEAAVGPLEQSSTSNATLLNDNESKFPQKAKTKKSIMNEWLNQADSLTSNIEHSADVNFNTPAVKSLDSLVQAAATMCSYTNPNHSTVNYSKITEEPQNFSFVAKKVEEFIFQSGREQDEEDVKWTQPSSLSSFTAQETNTGVCSGNHTNVSLPFTTPPGCVTVGGSGSAAKKRWLRQAISEECSDDLTSPQNGFSTPLKKRRVARQCSEMTPEEVSHSIMYNSVFNTDIVQIKTSPDTSPKIDIEMKEEEQQEEHVHQQEQEQNIDQEMKQEVDLIDGQDDDIDIINSPSPDEKIVVEDNLVKIEPEDEEKDEKIDVVEDSFSTKEEEDEEDEEEEEEQPNIKEEMKIEENEIDKDKDEAAIEDDVVEEQEGSAENSEIVEEEKKLIEIKEVAQSEEFQENVIEESPRMIEEESKIDVDPIETKEEFEINKVDIKEEPITFSKVEELCSLENKNEAIEEFDVDIKHTEIIEVKQESELLIEDSKNEINDFQEEEEDKEKKPEFSMLYSPSCTEIIKEEIELKPIEEQNQSSFCFSDEIADIQKRLHSFHTENILFLKSRNKKTKPTSMSSQLDDIIPSIPMRLKNKKTVQLSFDLSVQDDQTVSVKLKEPKEEPDEPIDIFKPTKIEFIDDELKEEKKTELEIIASIEKDKEKGKEKEKEDVKPEPIVATVKEERHTRWDKPDESRLALAMASVTATTPQPTVVPIPIQQEKIIDEKQHNIWDKIQPISNSYPYLLSNNNSATPTTGYIMPTVLPIPVPPPIPTHLTIPIMHVPPPNTPASHMQYYNTVYGKFSQDDNKNKYPSFSLLSDYLDTTTTTTTTATTTITINKTSLTNPTTTFRNHLDTAALAYCIPSTLIDTQQTVSIGQQQQPPPLSLQQQQQQQQTPQHSYYSMNSSTSLISSFLNKSYSTESIIPITTATTSITGIGVGVTAGSTKVFTRTQSADPRLNPNLNVPEPPPAPKRKLSINEYRKRKQQTTEVTEKSNPSSSSSSSSSSPTLRTTMSSENTNGLSKIDSPEQKDGSPILSGKLMEETDKEVLFSPAPTELELQQEILSERLKTFKSLQQLTAGTSLPSKTEENGVFTSLNLKDKEFDSHSQYDSMSRPNRLSTGSNSSSSSFSSMNSDQAAISPQQPPSQ